MPALEAHDDGGLVVVDGLVAGGAVHGVVSGLVCVYSVGTTPIQSRGASELPRDTPGARQNDNVPTTKIRSVRVDDDLWEAAARVAARNRETVADVIRRALLAYAGDELEENA